MDTKNKVKLAAVQMDIKIAANRENLEKILLNIRTAARHKADLIAFPECALCGYVYSSREAALPYMETIPGPSTDKLAAVCRELGVYTVVGMLEKAGEKCYNSAVLLGPEGLIGVYRKNHLPFLGIDRFIDSGNSPFRVYDTPIAKIGLHICYDCTFPESARIMALMGSDILVLPTNWPEGRSKVARYVVNTRAFENRVHLMAVDRVGVERRTRFIGGSRIISAAGDTLAVAGDMDEQIIYAAVDLAEARNKRQVLNQGEFIIDCFRDRKPELYGRISEPWND